MRMAYPKMRTYGRGGFVLVTSLLILVVMVVLGAGAFFLTMMNLRIAENTRSSAIAQFNAYEGVDLALIALAREYRVRSGESWPSLGELHALLPADAPYAPIALDLDPAATGEVPQSGSVTVQGVGPLGAVYESSARFTGLRTPIELPPGTEPLFGVGFVTPEQITINGNARFEMSLWAGKGISGSATRVLDGAERSAKAGFRNGVDGTPAECRLNTNSEVECVSGQTPPDPDPFDFDIGLAELLEERYGEDATLSSCAETFSGTTIVNATTYVGSTICLDENAVVTLTGTARGLYVLGPRSATVDLQASSVPTSAEDPLALKVAAGTIRFDNYGTSAAELGGVNTFYAVDDLNLKNVKSAVTGDSEILFATEGSLVMGASLGGSKKADARTLDAVIWANGSVCKLGSGGLSFNGAIVARGESGHADGCPGGAPDGIYWNGGGGGQFTTNLNPDIPEDDGGGGEDEFDVSGIRVLAKRP
jgi:hypothetical protein